jgi:hypothetical protein
MHNLALEPEKNRDTILRMNGLLNELIAREVGVNDGRFLRRFVSIGTASAPLQRGVDSAVTLTPEQRAVVRVVVRDELQDGLGNRIADWLGHLTPAQREALRSALKQGLAAEVREGLSDRIADGLGGESGSAESGIVIERVSGKIRDNLSDRLAQLTPEQRAFVRTVMRERMADELRESLADRIADGFSLLTPEQRDALRTALKQRLAAEVREGLSERLASQILDGNGD